MLIHKLRTVEIKRVFYFQVVDENGYDLIPHDG